MVTPNSPDICPAPQQRLSLSLCLGFSVGTVGVSIMLNTVTSFYPAFMSTVLGQSPEIAGYLLMIAKLADAVIDVAVGSLSDRARTRWGRRKPFLLAGGMLSAMSFLMLFAPPPLSQGALMAWMIAGLLIYSTAYSLFNVPYMALPAELTDGYHERTRLISFRTVFVSIGQLLATAGTAALVQKGGAGRDGYATMGLVMALVIAGAMTATALSVPVGRNSTAPDTADTAARPRHLPGPAQFRAIGRNRPFMLLLGAKVFQFLAFASVASTTLLFMLNVVGIGYDGQIVMALTQNLVAALAMPLWVWCGRRIGKRRTYLIGVVLFCLASLSWLLADQTITTAGIAARAALAGLGSGALLLMSVSMLGDTQAFDRALTGEAREGLLSSAVAVVEKVSFALGVAVLGVFLRALDYMPTTGGAIIAQPPRAILALKLGFAVIPALLFLCNGLFLWFYDLDEERLAAAVAAPVPG